MRRAAPAVPTIPDRRVLTVMAQGWVMFGVIHGLDPDELCKGSGFSRADIADPNQQIPFAWYAALRKQVIERLPGIDVGIELGSAGSLGQLGYVGMAIQHCGTPLDAMRLLMRYMRVA